LSPAFFRKTWGWTLYPNPGPLYSCTGYITQRNTLVCLIEEIDLSGRVSFQRREWRITCVEITWIGTSLSGMSVIVKLGSGALSGKGVFEAAKEGDLFGVLLGSIL